MDHGRVYLGILHKVIESTQVGKSVRCRLGLGVFEFVALFKYLQVVSATEQLRV